MTDRSPASAPRRAVALSLTLALVAGLALPAAAADQKGRFAKRGVAGKTCRDFLDARQSKSALQAAFAGWLDGYLTAINQYTSGTYDAMSFESTGLLMALIANNCPKNPDATFFDMVNALTQALIGDRLTTQSPVVQAVAGGKSVGIYQVTLERAQQRLADAGYYLGGVDGTFNDDTRKAFEAFQEAKGITVTGLPDQLTLLTLFRGGGKSKSKSQ